MGDNLFNEKTIKELTKDTKISNKHRLASKKWLYYLEKEMLSEERKAYTQFPQTILQELLGYNLDMEYLIPEENQADFTHKKDGKNKLKIELKSVKTKDLFKKQMYRNNPESPVDQLWRYMSESSPPVDYGIVTNYQKFILFKFSEGKKKYYEFDFLSIKNDDEKLKEFVSIFSKESIDNNFIVKLREKSEIQDKNITNDLYKIYHETRLMMINEFQENNVSKEEAIHFAQLYLNRLMFIFFAEDIDLIDKKILEKLIINSLDLGISENSEKICNGIKELFEDLDKGSKENEIFGFNGGLFKQEISRRVYFKDIKENQFFRDCKQNYKFKEKDIKISKEKRIIFNKHKNRLNPIIRNILFMASYDFKTDVNVNILGHIFEQSISDLEELKGNKELKRKREGVFYTPEYITEYICKNTIIPYLSKRENNEVSELIKEYKDNIGELEEKAKQIKILDPACGSGAFLIKATEILLEIFKSIYEVKDLQKEYNAQRGLKRKSNIEGQLTLKRWNDKNEIKKIIENNIYGVDINEESIEITKLSLFLKLVQRNKKLPVLSNNIKQGNSLVSNEEIAGKLAFDWNVEFPFKFDVVVGNPPYVEARSIEQKFVDFLRENYKTSGNRINTFASFIERGIELLKDNSYFSFIIHRNLIRSNDYHKTRRFILDNTKIKQILSFTQGVFEGVTGEMTIIILNKTKEKKDNNPILVYKHDNKITPNLKPENIKQGIFEQTAGNRFNIYLTNKKIKLLEKMKEDCMRMGDVAETLQGIIVGNEKKYVSKKKENEKYKSILRGKDISRYGFPKPKEYLYYVSGTKVLTRGKTPNLFEKEEKILTQHVSGNITATLDNQQNYFLQTINSTTSIDKNFKNKYLLVLLNSKLLNFYYSSIFNLGAEFTTAVAIENLDELPIKKISFEEQKPFIEQAELMLNLNKEFYEKKDKFLIMLKSDTNLNKISKKLQKFYILNWNDFEDELKKNKIFLSGILKDDWFDRFRYVSKELRELKEKIDKIDNEINDMVYEIYNITEEEKQIIESS